MSELHWTFVMRTIISHDVLFDVMELFPYLWTSLPSFWRHDVVLTPWCNFRTFRCHLASRKSHLVIIGSNSYEKSKLSQVRVGSNIAQNFSFSPQTFWCHDVFLMSWRTLWHDTLFDVFFTSWQKTFCRPDIFLSFREQNIIEMSHWCQNILKTIW